MDLAKEHNCNVMASECWRTYSQAFGIRSCFIFGDLIDRGLMVACRNRYKWSHYYGYAKSFFVK